MVKPSSVMRQVDCLVIQEISITPQSLENLNLLPEPSERYCAGVFDTIQVWFHHWQGHIQLLFFYLFCQ